MDVNGWKDIGPSGKPHAFVTLAMVSSAAALFFGLWLLDFPKPMVDDLFYSGAGLHLAEGGDFSNPLLERQEFPSHYFFVYPPVHSYVLAGWLKIFGVSAKSMTGFQAFMYFLVSVSTVLVLRSGNSPVWLGWLVPFAMSGAFLNMGLRPEPLAAALIMSGLAAMLPGGQSRLLLFLAFLLLFLGGATAPRFLFFAGWYALYFTWRAWRHPAKEDRYTRIILIGTAFLASCLAILLMVHFRANEFQHTFRMHAERVTGSKLWLLRHFLGEVIGVTRWPILLLMIGLLAVSFRKKRGELETIAWHSAGVLLFAGVAGALGVGTIWFILLILLILAAARLREWTRRQAILTEILFCLCLLSCISRPSIEVLGLLAGKIKTDLGSQRNIALQLAADRRPNVLVDVNAARYALDYHIPPGWINWEFPAPYPAMVATDVSLRKGDVFVLGPVSISVMQKKHFLNLSPPKWSPIGSANWAFFEQPRNVFVIDADTIAPSPRTARLK